jgi:hypothetical protein
MIVVGGERYLESMLGEDVKYRGFSILTPEYTISTLG